MNYCNHPAAHPAREFFHGSRPALKQRYAEFDAIYDPLVARPGLSPAQLDWLDSLRERFRWDAYFALVERFEDGSLAPAGEVAQAHADRALAALQEAARRFMIKREVA